MSTTQPPTVDSSEIVRRCLEDSMIKGDPGAVDRYFAEDVIYIPVTSQSPELTAIMPWVGVHHGREGVREFYEFLLANFEVVEFELELAFGSHEHAALFGRMRYRAKSTGKEVDSDWAIRATVYHGQITYFHFYEDDYTLATAFRRTGSWEIENHLGRCEVPSPEVAASDPDQAAPTQAVHLAVGSTGM